MRKFNAKQLGLIAGCLIAAIIIDWVVWFLLMKHPTEIDAMYHILVVICLTAAFVVVGDKYAKTAIFR